MLGPETQTTHKSPPHFDPAFWDPLYAVACEFTTAFWGPVRADVTEALAVLEELCGYGNLCQDHWAIDAFVFTLADSMMQGLGFPERRRLALLQLVANFAYHRSPEAHRLDRAFYWTFLNDLVRKYLGTGMSEDRLKLSSIINEFLNHYRLGGEDNEDLVEGLNRLLIPRIRDGIAFLREKSSLICRDVAGASHP